MCTPLQYAHMVRIFNFPFISFLEIAAFKKFSILNEFEEKTNSSIERMCNDKANSDMCVFEVGGSKIWNNFLYKFG